MEYFPGDVIDNCSVATWTHNDLVTEAYQHVSAEVNVNYGSKGHAGLLTCYSNAQNNQPGAVKSRISRVFLPETTKNKHWLLHKQNIHEAYISGPLWL